MKTIKFIILIMILILTSIIGTGCRNGNPDNSSIPVESSSPAKTAPKAISIDLKGRQVRIAYEIQIPSVTNPNNDIFTKMMFERIPYIENKYNCHIILTYFDAMEDIQQIAMYNSASKISSGSIIPLDDYLDYKGEVLGANEYGLFLQDRTFFGGLHYGLDVSPGRNGFDNGSMMRYNKTLIQSKGLRDPYELMLEGNWTWEAFLTIAAALKEDVNGDGINDRWALVEGNANDIVNDFVLSNNAGYFKNVNGQNVYSLDEPNAIEALTFVRSLFNENGVAIDMTGSNGMPKFDQTSQDMYKNAIFQNVWEPDFSTVDGIEYGTVLFPKGPKADRYIITNEATGVFYAIPSTARDPAVIAQLMYDLFVFWDPTKDIKITREDMMNNYILNGIDDQAIRDKILYIRKQSGTPYTGPYSMTMRYSRDSAFGFIAASVLGGNKDLPKLVADMKNAAQQSISSSVPLP
jgi:hypothetical protein